MKRIMILAFAVSILLLSACSGGIDKSYKEVEQLLVIQAMGFDSTSSGVVLSVSSGSDGMGGQSEAATETLRLKASAKTLLEAQEIIQDYSASEELFFSHTSYIVLGESALSNGIAPYLDYIERDDAFRLDVPLFAVSGGSAEELVVGTGNESYDAVNVLSSVERNVTDRGSAHVYNAGEVAADLGRNGSALICAVRTVSAQSVLPDAAKGETTAVFDGYVVLRDGKLVGKISADDALAVNLIHNEAGSSLIALSDGDEGATLMLSGCDCVVSAVCKNGELSGLKVSLSAKASLKESGGAANIESLNAEFKNELLSRLTDVLRLSHDLGCDFLQLGSVLQRSDPFALVCNAEEFQELLPKLHIYIYVETEIDSGYVIERR